MINTGISSDPVRKEIETLDENKGSNLTMEQLSEVAGGGKDDDGGKGGVICPQCKVENHPAHTSIRNERRFTCWRRERTGTL